MAMQAQDRLMQTAVAKKVVESFQALDEATKGVLRSVKGKLEEWAKMQIEKNLRKLLVKVPPLLKEKLKDKHMCGCVKDLIDDLVDDIWPEVEAELMLTLKFNLNYLEKYEIPEPICNCCLCRVLWKVVAWYRYTTRPVDKTVWQRLRWVSFWILFVVSLFPFYCVSPGLLLIDFLMIDKQDEFQLVEFVLGFKKFQFFSFGVIRGIVGFCQYYACVNYSSITSSKNPYLLLRTHRCSDYGPGSGSVFVLELISLVIMCGLAWLATLCLTCSVKKGVPKFRYLAKEETAVTAHKKSCLCVCCCPAQLCRYPFK